MKHKIIFEPNEDNTVHEAIFEQDGDMMIFKEANFSPNFFEDMTKEAFDIEFSFEIIERS